MTLQGVAGSGQECITLEEKESLRSELLWLVTHEMPAVCNEVLTKYIEPFLDLTSGDKKDEEGAAAGQAPQFVQFDASGLKGFLKVQGSLLTYAEISGKLPGRTASIRTEIKPENPTRLTQVQNAHNYAALVRMKLLEFVAISEAASAAHTCQACSEAMLLISEIEKAMRWLVNAKQELLLPPPMPQSAVSTSILSPPLPGDIFIDVGIADSQILLSVYAIGAKRDRERTSAGTQGSAVGLTIRHSKKMVEITDHLQVRCTVPSITRSTALVKSAHSTLADLHEKLSILHSYHTDI